MLLCQVSNFLAKTGLVKCNAASAFAHLQICLNPAEALTSIEWETAVATLLWGYHLARKKDFRASGRSD